MLEDGVGEEPRLAARELSFEEGGPFLLENLVAPDVILRRQREQKRPTQEPASAGSMAGIRWSYVWGSGSGGTRGLLLALSGSHPLKPKPDLTGLSRRYDG